MQDYEVSIGPNVDFEHVSQFAMFSDCDPVLFEDAMKEEKWQKEMMKLTTLKLLSSSNIRNCKDDSFIGSPKFLTNLST